MNKFFFIVTRLFITIILEILFTFGFIYIAFIYRYHQKARSVIYSYWLYHDPNRFKTYLRYNDLKELDIDSKYIFYDNELVLLDNHSTNLNLRFRYFGYKKDFERMKTKNFINTLIYYFYYIFIYIFLDDIYNLNGVNTKVLNNPKYFRDFTEKEFVEYKQLKVVESVFNKKYWLDKTKIKFNIVMFFVSNSYTNNYFRDKCYYGSKINFPIIKFLYDKKYDAYVIHLFGRNLLWR